MVAPAPDGEGAARCMQMAIDDAKIEPSGVQYINAHGTSTDLNDKYETQAIKTVFGDQCLQNGGQFDKVDDGAPPRRGGRSRSRLHGPEPL